MVGAGLSYSVIVTLPPNTYGLALGGPIYQMDIIGGTVLNL